MAEEEEKKPEEQEKKSGGKPILFILLAVINSLAVIGIGVMLHLNKKKEEQKANVDDVIAAEQKSINEEVKDEEFIGKLIPLETFLVNLAGSRGRKLVKVTIELEVDNNDVQEEIEKIKPKIRDMIIMILSSNTYNQISTKAGKDKLRNSILDQVNLFLTRGQITNIYFTQFIYSN